MDDRDKWQERVREIYASFWLDDYDDIYIYWFFSSTSTYIDENNHIYIYVYVCVN